MDYGQEGPAGVLPYKLNEENQKTTDDAAKRIQETPEGKKYEQPRKAEIKAERAMENEHPGFNKLRGKEREAAIEKMKKSNPELVKTYEAAQKETIDARKGLDRAVEKEVLTNTGIAAAGKEIRAKEGTNHGYEGTTNLERTVNRNVDEQVNKELDKEQKSALDKNARFAAIMEPYNNGKQPAEKEKPVGPVPPSTPGTGMAAARSNDASGRA